MAALRRWAGVATRSGQMGDQAAPGWQFDRCALEIAGQAMARQHRPVTRRQRLPLHGLAHIEQAKQRFLTMSAGKADHIARDRQEAGYTSQLELRQAEAEYRAAEQQIPAAEAALARQENALSVLVGEPPRAIRRGTFAALGKPAIPLVLPSELTRRRPDILQAEYALAASDARMRGARAQFLPQIRLAASAGTIVSSALDDPVAIWSVGGSILAPIFNGGRLQGQFDAATAQRDQAAFTYRRTVLTAFREVEDQLAVISRLNEQEVSLRAQRVAVADAVRHASNRYRAGYSPYLEQIDAQRTLLSVDLALVQLKADNLTALVALYQALGGALQTGGADQ